MDKCRALSAAVSQSCAPVGEFLCCGSFRLADNPELDWTE